MPAGEDREECDFQRRREPANPVAGHPSIPNLYVPCTWLPTPFIAPDCVVVRGTELAEVLIPPGRTDYRDDRQVWPENGHLPN